MSGQAGAHAGSKHRRSACHNVGCGAHACGQHILWLPTAGAARRHRHAAAAAAHEAAPAPPATACARRASQRTCKLPRRCCTARWAGRKAARCATAALAVMLLLRHLRKGFVARVHGQCAWRGACWAAPTPGRPLTWARPPPRPSCCPLLDSVASGRAMWRPAGPDGARFPALLSLGRCGSTACSPKWALPAPLGLSQLAAWVEHSG